MRRYYSIGILLLLCSAAIAMAEPLVQPAETIPKAGSVFVIRPFENPLTITEVEQMRTRVMTNFKQRFQNPDHPLVLSSIDVPEGAFIAAYGFTIYADSMTSEYLGLVGDPQSVPIIHENAQKWYEETETYEGSGAQILCSEWTKIGSGAKDWYVYPYGGVTNNYELYFCSDDSSSSYDWYAIKHTFKIIPGYYTYGSEWESDEGYSIHRWGETELQNPVLVDFGPDTPVEGPATVPVCIEALESECCELCWSFWLGWYTKIYNMSDSPSVIAAWKMEFTANSARRNIRTMITGSICRVDEPSSTGTYKLTRLQSVGRFTDGSTIEQIKCAWIIYVDY